MATLTTPNYASRIKCGSPSHVTRPKATAARFGSRSHSTKSHEGLRLLNNVAEPHLRSLFNVTARQVRGKKLKNGNSRPCAVVVCAGGMNLIFVGSEVGPWSKTGGLGDVLGGLPPAMAVSLLTYPVILHRHKMGT